MHDTTCHVQQQQPLPYYRDDSCVMLSFIVNCCFTLAAKLLNILKSLSSCVMIGLFIIYGMGMVLFAHQFLPRDALVHSAILRLHVVRLSVCL